MEASDVCEEVPSKLWVDRYAPRAYTDLLSEEVWSYFHWLSELLSCVSVVKFQQYEVTRSLILVWCCSFIDRCITHSCFDAVGWVAGRHPACKNWVVRCWHGYLSGARCKWFACGEADTTASPLSLAPVKSRMVYLSGAGLPRLS